jgi:hypothetical protein
MSYSGTPAASDFEYTQLSFISYVKPIEKYLAFEPRSVTKSQLYSHIRLNTL